MTGTATGFLYQANGAYGHPSIHCLAHIINRQQGNGYRRQRFHFHPGSGTGADRCLTGDTGCNGVFRFRRERQIDMRDRQRMAQWHQISRSFGSHQAGDTRYAQHIAFAVSAGENQLQRFRLHKNASLGNSATVGFGLIAYIDHMRFAGAIEMIEFGHNPSIEDHRTSTKWHGRQHSNVCFLAAKWLFSRMMNMEVHVRYFAGLRERLGKADERVGLKEGSTVRDLSVSLGLENMEGGPWLTAVNAEYAVACDVLHHDDEVAFFPKVTGG